MFGEVFLPRKGRWRKSFFFDYYICVLIIASSIIKGWPIKSSIPEAFLVLRKNCNTPNAMLSKFQPSSFDGYPVLQTGAENPCDHCTLPMTMTIKHKPPTRVVKAYK